MSLLRNIGEDTKDLVERAKDWMNKLIAFEGFAWIIEDTKDNSGYLKPIPKLGSIIKSNKTNEEWLRADIAIRIRGVPVYLCLPEIPFTIGMTYINGLYMNRVDYDRDYFKEKLTEYNNISVAMGERLSRWDKIKTILYLALSAIFSSIIATLLFGNPII